MMYVNVSVQIYYKSNNELCMCDVKETMLQSCPLALETCKEEHYLQQILSLFLV